MFLICTYVYRLYTMLILKLLFYRDRQKNEIKKDVKLNFKRSYLQGQKAKTIGFMIPSSTVTVDALDMSHF